MNKTEKAKPGTMAELAETYAAPRSIPVRITRVTGDGKDRAIHYETSSVMVYPLPIDQLGRIVDILEPVMSATEPKRMLQFVSENKAAVYAAVSEATGWSVEDIGHFDGDDFLTVLFAIIDANNDFFVRLLGLVGFGLPGTAQRSGNGAGPTPSVSFGAGGTPTPNATPSENLARQ